MQQLFVVNFNSRTHVECDLLHLHGQRVNFISTHALTWSATSTGNHHFHERKFQLTHSRGVRPVMCSSWKRGARFQLTHSRGVRPRNSRARRHAVNFNSRTHVECDNFQIPQEPMPQISTHALTWSATVIRMFLPRCRTFQLTHSRGVRPFCLMLYLQQIQISTHALTWSATIATAPPGAPKRDFNSRTHVECDVHHVFRFRCIH